MEWYWRVVLISWAITIVLGILIMVVASRNAPIEDPLTGELITDEEYERRRDQRIREELGL